MQQLSHKQDTSKNQYRRQRAIMISEKMKEICCYMRICSNHDILYNFDILTTEKHVKLKLCQYLPNRHFRMIHQFGFHRIPNNDIPSKENNCDMAFTASKPLSNLNLL
jgi:hypothetical protein